MGVGASPTPHIAFYAGLRGLPRVTCGAAVEPAGSATCHLQEHELGGLALDEASLRRGLPDRRTASYVDVLGQRPLGCDKNGLTCVGPRP